MGMICTQCWEDTENDVDLSDQPIKIAVELCQNWLCSECLDKLEDAEEMLESSNAGARTWQN